MKSFDGYTPGKFGVITSYFFWGKEKRDRKKAERKGLENNFINQTVIKISNHPGLGETRHSQCDNDMGT